MIRQLNRENGYFSDQHRPLITENLSLFYGRSAIDALLYRLLNIFRLTAGTCLIVYAHVLKVITLSRYK